MIFFLLGLKLSLKSQIYDLKAQFCLSKFIFFRYSISTGNWLWQERTGMIKWTDTVGSCRQLERNKERKWEWESKSESRGEKKELERKWQEREREKLSDYDARCWDTESCVVGVHVKWWRGALSDVGWQPCVFLCMACQRVLSYLRSSLLLSLLKLSV